MGKEQAGLLVDILALYRCSQLFGRWRSSRSSAGSSVRTQSPIFKTQGVVILPAADRGGTIPGKEMVGAPAAVRSVQAPAGSPVFVRIAALQAAPLVGWRPWEGGCDLPSGPIDPARSSQGWSLAGTVPVGFEIVPADSEIAPADSGIGLVGTLARGPTFVGSVLQ